MGGAYKPTIHAHLVSKQRKTGVAKGYKINDDLVKKGSQRAKTNDNLMTSQKVNDVMISYPSYEKPGSQKAKIHIFKKSISRKLLDENEKFFF